jgi:hypothetical protein
MTGLLGQEPEQNCKDRIKTTRAEQKREDSQKRQACKAAKTRQ